MTNVKAEVQGAFKELGIDASNDSNVLGDDLALDSQGLVDLVCELEKRLHIVIPDNALRRNSTVDQVIRLSEQLSHGNGHVAGAQVSEGGLTEQISMGAPVTVVYKYLHDVTDWPKLLPHVESIDIIYDDGRYQEFYMGIKGVDSGIVKVRSIRRCQENEITFFQPDPPKFFTRHAGGWKFSSNGPKETLVTTYHSWTLSPRAAELYPANPTADSAQQVEAMMRGHARSVLTSWKELTEKREQ